MEINSLRPGSAGNQPQASPRTGRSRIAMEQIKAQTCRFAEFKPHFVMEIVPKDKITLRCSQVSRSYTLKAPLMQNINLHRDYFVVPMQSILPFNWDKFIIAPKDGDDVPFSCGPTVSGSSLRVAFSSALNVLVDDSGIYTVATLRAFIFLSLFLSKDSLLYNLEYDFARYYRDWSRVEDAFLNGFMSLPTGTTIRCVFSYGTRSYFVGTVSGFRSFVLDVMDEPTASIDFGSFVQPISTAIRSIVDTLRDNELAVDLPKIDGVDLPDFNMSRFLAYQMVVAHFYSNDNVDFVYSADLFRQYVSAVCQPSITAGETFYNDWFFEWNGIKCPFDYCSSAVLGNSILIALMSLNVSSDSELPLFGPLGLLSYRRSLKFVDYFTGARSRALANVDVTFNVNNNIASAVDVTRSIQAQRYANAINKTRRTLKGFVDSFFGAKMSYDYHDPMFLGHTSDVVFTAEVENTGDAQQDQPNSVTASFRSNSNKYAFEFESDVYGVILGLSWFDIKRLYTSGMSPFNTYLDRDDYYNPYFQFIGDQPILHRELPIAGSSIEGSDSVFGYTLRDMQYKTLINRCFGGFIDNLPGWCFNKSLSDDRIDTITPDIIRSRPSEIDDLYLSLTGGSLPSYFHFIMVSTNYVDATRPMVHQPEILG